MVDLLSRWNLLAMMDFPRDAVSMTGALSVPLADAEHAIAFDR